MHDYSVRNYSKKIKVIYWISAIAVVITPSLVKFLDLIFTKIPLFQSLYELSSILGCSISAFLVFSFLWLCYSKCIWKLLYNLGIGRVPDISGIWDCNGVGRKYNEIAEENLWTGTVRIEQNYEKISIILTTENSQSKSYSLVGDIEVHGKNEAILTYMYENEPSKVANGLNHHIGFCRLAFDLRLGTATGRYYTDNDRSSYGSMDLIRKNIGES